jgi:hypothetical protein
MRPGAACLVSVAALSVLGCGGSDEPTFTRESVEESMTTLHRDQLEGGATMDPLECVQDGDEFHWKCLADVRQGEQLYRFSTDVTCDEATGRCISEPTGASPVG